MSGRRSSARTAWSGTTRIWRIGSGSVTLNRVTVGAGAIVAAACLVPEGFEVPPGALVAGVPAKVKRTGVPAGFAADSVQTYIESGRVHRAGLRRLDRP
jgi:carbonic anhydrase/acetyltransferase-like protein (isoleucine patch superfamily)